MTQRRYAVVLAQPDISEAMLPAVVEVCMNEAGMMRIDATAATKRMKGILLPSADKFTAKRVAEGVNELGIRAGVAPLDAADRFARRWPVVRGGCSRQGLHADPGRKGMRVFPWDRVHAVSVVLYREIHVAPVSQEPYSILTRMTTLTLPADSVRGAVEARSRMLRSSKTIEGEETWILDLFIRDPDLTLRIDARKFDYGYLGDRMHPRCEANFHMFMSHLAEGAREAAFSPLAQQFLGGDLLHDARLTDLKQFDLYNRWLLLAAAAFGA